MNVLTVFTWDGSHSVLGEDKIRTRNPNEKRQWLEEYEEELDRGKVLDVILLLGILLGFL